ncbi:hypothetical protein [Trujillonella endophytica]|uniref:Uncharacterized protein n=1 Tax=Trujillonella endophytica TaxID=673521 RepID=A0A1H8PXJ6_9ACTN|nr:hypothetical protein [Trujillella endophytica]SEO46650.1 hypothetical protein SAMN05660991_00444 [Trujillella endophytica]
MARVVRDVEATTDLPRGWRITVQEDPHPLAVDSGPGGVAVWTCPQAPDPAWPIGELPPRPASGAG